MHRPSGARRLRNYLHEDLRRRGDRDHGRQLAALPDRDRWSGLMADSMVGASG
ncbi:hypothetical protein ABZV34_27205 [Streptomyces sp. NPDC005195]|uniref:hypothetical protein n=1 Tax=Streptomyces sp. NPDC005195 TaxID=3154561 RepID=UPI0033B93EF1